MLCGPQALKPRYTKTRGEAYCVALRGYLRKCRARFGAHVLRCDFAAGRATACTASVYRMADPRSHNACGVPMALSAVLMLDLRCHCCTRTWPAAHGDHQSRRCADESPWLKRSTVLSSFWRPMHGLMCPV